ncbi:hypothetical protein BGW41_002058 [Actinomortierella wolfii]|nr:hypothetical protein BGW41_002058 [Actinomortierella wolfii]
MSEMREDALTGNRRYAWLESLKRFLAPVKPIATTITMASVITGIVPLSQEGLITGGPVLMIHGFAITGFMVMMVALSLAEVASSFAGVRGGVVEYVRRLAPPGHPWQRIGPWIAGLLHFLAYTMGVSSVCFSFSLFATAGIQVVQGVTPPRIVTVTIHIVASVLCGAVNAFKIELSLLSMIWHTLGAVIIVITVIAAQRNPPSITWVFTHYENQTGWSNDFYVGFLGLILGGFTLTGYDAPIHTEYNTPDAARKVPQAIIFGVMAVITMGEVLILTLLFAITDLDVVLEAKGTGIAGLEIFLQLLGKGGCMAMLVIFLGTFFFCAQGVLRAASAIGHELATFNVLPRSGYFAKLNKREQPGRVGWLISSISSFVGLLYLFNSTALIALTSAVAIELTLVYTLPPFTRLMFPDPGRTRVPAGPFCLGRWSKPVNILAVTWAGFITIIFCFPTAYPITIETMNYSSCLLVITLAFIFGYWFYSGRHWYGHVLKGELRDKKPDLHPANVDDMAEMPIELDHQNWLTMEQQQKQQSGSQGQTGSNKENNERYGGDGHGAYDSLCHAGSKGEALQMANAVPSLGYQQFGDDGTVTTPNTVIDNSSNNDNNNNNNSYETYGDGYCYPINHHQQPWGSVSATAPDVRHQSSQLHELTQQSFPAIVRLPTADSQYFTPTDSEPGRGMLENSGYYYHSQYQPQQPVYGQEDGMTNPVAQQQQQQQQQPQQRQELKHKHGAGVINSRGKAGPQGEDDDNNIVPIREEDFVEIEQWLDHMERDLRECRA